MKITAITKYKHGELYAILKRINWTQSELARQTGLDAGTIGNIINLVKRPTPEQADAIQNALGNAGEYLDVLSEWPETFAGLKRGYKRETTANVQMERLLDHPEVMNLPAPEATNDNLEDNIEQLVGTLPKRAQFVLRERFWNRKTLKDIERDVKISRERVRQIERKGIFMLQKKIRIEKQQECGLCAATE